MSDEPYDINAIIEADGRYRPEAYAFLHDGLSQAVEQVHGKDQPGDHVTGQQLCMALRDLAAERYGLLASTVLRRWGICASIDFGNIVYLLIEHGVMRKTEEDSIDDFRDVFDLESGFSHLRDKITMRS